MYRALIDTNPSIGGYGTIYSDFLSCMTGLHVQCSASHYIGTIFVYVLPNIAQ